MPLKKVIFRPGVNRENTRYAQETMGGAQATGGWFEADKIRFRGGTPEKIGGWIRISAATFLGVCRSLINWATLGSIKLIGVGTNLKYYLERGGLYNDITPIRESQALTNPFTATNGSMVVTVADTAHGCRTGDFVTFSGAISLGGNITAAILNMEYQVAVTNANVYTITTTATASASDTLGGGAGVVAAYQVNVGPAFAVPLTGYGAGAWGDGTWGAGSVSLSSIRVWTHATFGEDLLFSYYGGAIYYWDATAGVSTRGVALASLPGASDVPTIQSLLLVSDPSRFVFAFGCNDIGSAVQDFMLIRWSDQENAVDWTPSATNQAGSLRLSHGSGIIAAVQTRQEIVVITNSAVYSLQYSGPPAVWGAQLMADNISIQSPNSVIVASGVVYWMGLEKFYKYDGRVQTLRCDLRGYVFQDINLYQRPQVFAGTSEGFNEVWWFYCPSGSTVASRYVVYNYAEDVWYYGNMERTAWLDSGILGYPVAATYLGNLVNHEQGVDNLETGTPVAIEAFIESSEFDIDDGHSFGFIWRVLPDLTFRGSSGDLTPQCTMTLIPMQNSGSGQNTPPSVAGSSTATIQRIATAPIEEFTGQVFIRVRGRQLIFKISSNQLGTQWQLGIPRIDIRQDGRR